MIAEIKGKLNDSRFDKAERLEDALTGNVFGNLRYLPLTKGLKRILKDGIFPQKQAEIFDNIDAEKWDDKIEFWPTYKESEPDILITFDNLVVLIEVKYNSPLSSCDQLERYAELLGFIAEDKEKVLILIADEKEARSIYEENVTNEGLSTLGNIPFGYLTWQKTLDVLNMIKNNGVLDGFEEVIVNDLIELLDLKGFGGFRSFDIGGLSVDKTEMWFFDDSVAVINDFSFLINLTVERGMYYEFG